MAGLDPKILEQLRRGIPLRMDATGRFWLDNEPVTHPRVIAAFRNGLDVTPQGEHTLHVGNQWCYIKIADAPLRVNAVAHCLANALTLRLDDGRTLTIDPANLAEQPHGGLWTTVPSQLSGRPLLARFTNRAQMDLDPFLSFDEHTQMFALAIGGHRFGIAQATPAGLA